MSKRTTLGLIAIGAAILVILFGGTIVLPLLMFGEAQAEAATCYAPQQISGTQLSAEQ